jgi:tryptophan halogenase
MQIDLYYTDTIKTIGVGEGGGPRLKKFLENINIDETKFINKTNATKKWGILFEDWGYTRKEAIHHFTPPK